MSFVRRAAGLLAIPVLLAVAVLFAMAALRVGFAGTEAERSAARAAAEAAGVPLESRKTLVVVASGSVAAPAGRVWEVLSRLEEWPLWAAPLRRGARWKGEAGFRVGGAFGQVLDLGVPLGTVVTEETVTRLAPGREVAWCRSDGGIVACELWRLVPVTPRRTFVVNVEVLHGRPVALLAPFVQSRWNRLRQRGVSGLARRAEGADAP